MTRRTSRPGTAEPRHADLATRLQVDIARGRYVVGSLLPTELELAGQFGVSRQTVRSALQTLQDRGLISRKKGVGSLVENAESVGRGYSQRVESLDDLVQIAATETRRLEHTTRLTLDRTESRALEAPLGSEWVCFAGLRVDARHRDRPISCFRILVDARFARIADSVRGEPDVLVASLLERECGQSIEEVHQHVFATRLDEAAAKVLRCEPGMPALRILRHYRTARHRIIEITETLYPADRIRVSSSLRRNRPAGAAK